MSWARHRFICIIFALANAPGFANSSTLSFETCALVTSEYLTVLQLASRNLDPETLKEALPDITDQAKKRVSALYGLIQQEGLPETYSRVNSEYASCAKRVYRERGMPAAGSREGYFHFCAGENKQRYEALLAAILGANLEEVLRQRADTHTKATTAVFKLYQSDGALAVFDSMATELKYCINGSF